MLIGGGQEHGLRAGTENVAFIAALGKYLDLSLFVYANNWLTCTHIII